MSDGFTYHSGHTLAPVTNSWRSYPPASPHRLTTTTSGPALHTDRSEDLTGFGRLVSMGSSWTRPHGYGNINPLSIDYACRPRLRSRLTLGGRTCPRNPWSSGGRDSHSAFATHACILTRMASTASSRCRFDGHTTLPYPSTPLHTVPKNNADVLCE
jgi:hypothetical protein